MMDATKFDCELSWEEAGRIGVRPLTLAERAWNAWAEAETRADEGAGVRFGSGGAALRAHMARCGFGPGEGPPFRRDASDDEVRASGWAL